MDPASVVSLVGSGLAVAGKTLKNLHELSDKFRNAEQSVQVLIAKLSTLRAALVQLQILLLSEHTTRFTTPQLQSDLVSAMRPCTVVMSAIDQHICQIKTGWLKGRLRYLWDEGIIREHGVHLDSQISALNLLLQVIQLSSSNEQRNILGRRQSRRILRRAQDDASSYLSASSFGSSTMQDGVEFDFDNQLINSNAYRAAFRNWTNTQRKPNDPFTTTSSSTLESKKSSLLDPFADGNIAKTSEKQPSKNKARLRWHCLNFRHDSDLATSSFRSKWKVCVVIAIVLIVGGSFAAIITTQVLRRHHTSAPKLPSNAETSSFPTGFPIIPLTSATILRPDLVTQSSGCVSPSTYWSCAVPPEDQAAISPNDPDQPNFQFQIMTKNESETTSPAPPSSGDRIFLGNTTDNITSPFDGINTPFFVSFQFAQRQLQKRQQTAIPTSSTALLNLASMFPAATKSSGIPADPTLVPIPTYQPLRLFDKGLKTEHYGFYNYFDRSIFLKQLTTGNDPTFLESAGGVTTQQANTRCTWAQTRFHVQIWTKLQNDTTQITNPGSFPLPVTITLDRHGGNATEKAVYCYSLAVNGEYVRSGGGSPTLILEDRAFGGALVNPSEGVIQSSNGMSTNIDGGSGGCQCVWHHDPAG